MENRPFTSTATNSARIFFWVWSAIESYAYNTLSMHSPFIQSALRRLTWLQTSTIFAFFTTVQYAHRTDPIKRILLLLVLLVKIVECHSLFYKPAFLGVIHKKDESQFQRNLLKHRKFEVHCCTLKTLKFIPQIIIIVCIIAKFRVTPSKFYYY